MAAARSSPIVLTLLMGLAAFMAGCNTGAVAIKECREIEYARCEAAPACGNEDVLREEDIAACKRFYKDQCLHGIAGPAVPLAQDHDDCVAAIEAAAACARRDPEADPADCEDVPADLVPEAKPLGDVCDVIGRPWDLKVCDYLLPRLDEDENGDDAGEGGAQG